MKVVKWLDKHLEEIILMVLCGIMACIMMFQVIMRYAFKNSLSWSEELTRFLFIWSAFLAISYCIRTRLAVRITLVVDALPGKLKYIMLIIVDLIEAAVYGFMAPYAYSYLMQTITNGQLSTAMRIPMWIIYLAPLVGFVLSVIRSLQMVYLDFKAMQSVDTAK
ncbi:MAG: TRAP transporter small permease [Clostridiales bacterium]|nr:TRAP transporter small permease [Clostridiales bacterium]